MNGPKGIGFLIDFILIFFEIFSLKVRNNLSQIIHVFIFHVKRGLGDFEASILVLVVESCVILVTIIVFVSINKRYRIGSVHELLVHINAWL